jgi:4a-hydroxytetrahydrobiopterin dehydratase
MPYGPLLPEAEIVEGLRALPEWRRDGAALTRTVACATFRDAIALVNRVADPAEAANHHPDMHVAWRRVTFIMTTKSAGGLSAKDFAMAAQIEGMIAALPARD